MTPEALKAEASARTGLSDFGADHFEEPLALWAEDLTAPHLSERGRAGLAKLMIADLARRLEVLDWLKRHPEIEDVPLPPILWISGHERTGTTLLHNLVALHPKARGLLRWELMRPCPPPEAATYRTDPRIAAAQASIDKLRGSPLEGLHWVNADEPDECQWALINGTSIVGGAPCLAMPRWGAWWNERQPREAFAEYRRVIQLLLWRNPPPEGAFLVLKCPQFANRLDMLSEVFPEARFILTHRDPWRAIRSTATLIAHVNAPFLAGRPDAMAFVMPRAEAKLAALVAFDRAAPAANVAYPALIDTPTEAVSGALRRCGIEPPGDMAARVDAFLAAQRAGRRAKPLAQMPDFGLDPDEFRARPAIAAYCAHFGVTPETRRRTG